jgi:hypothetical protein
VPSLPPSPHDSAIDTSKITPGFGAMLRKLMPYVWPADRADLKRRIYLAFALMFVAKLITIAVPYAFKFATDAVTGESRGPAPTTYSASCLGRWRSRRFTASAGSRCSSPLRAATRCSPPSR